MLIPINSPLVNPQTCTANTSTTQLRMQCIVANTGRRPGDHVLLLFHRPPPGTPAQQNPFRRLIDFQRTPVLEPGAMSVPITFEVSIPAELLLVSETGGPRRVKGEHVVEIQDGPSFKIYLD